MSQLLYTMLRYYPEMQQILVMYTHIHSDTYMHNAALHIQNVATVR